MTAQPVVYRIFDKSGRLIYVGATTNLEQRLSNHRTQSWWYRLLDRVESEPHPTAEAAFAAERIAIRTEQPAFNVSASGRNPDRQSRLTEADIRACQAWADEKPRGGLLPVWLRWTLRRRTA